MSRLIEPTDRGLYCERGGFYIDPWREVDRAVVTHAHADHCRPGMGEYLCSTRGVEVLRQRVHPGARIQGIAYGEHRDIQGVTVSLHPAGHLLGSAQVRVEHQGEVWVVSGDYKLGGDGTCEPFEPVRCHTFITESTFGLPVYRWPPQEAVIGEVNAWWHENRSAGRTSVLFGYALGKSQRLLHAVDAGIGPIVVHGSVKRFVDVYRDAGVAMPQVMTTGDAGWKEAKGRGLVVAPPSVLGTTWLRRFAPASTAFASGWMLIRGARRRRGVDRGFVMSDHVDWPGLFEAIRATGCERVGVTHGYSCVVVRRLQESGVEAYVVPTRYEGEAGAEGGDNGVDAEGEAAD